MAKCFFNIRATDHEQTPRVLLENVACTEIDAVTSICFKNAQNNRHSSNMKGTLICMVQEFDAGEFTEVGRLRDWFRWKTVGYWILCVRAIDYDI